MSEVAPDGSSVVSEVDIDQVVVLRAQVLRPGLPLEASQYPQDNDADTHHLAVRLGDGRVVGCATYFPQVWESGDPPIEGPAWRLRGMATAPEVRGTGVGGLLLRAGIELVTASGGALLWCHARSSALGFYEHHGFTLGDEEFLEGPMHIAHRLAWRPAAGS